MAEILAGTASGIHILPLLMQVLPDVSVVMEHTSALLAQPHKWSWLVWDSHILLFAKWADVLGRCYAEHLRNGRDFR